MATRSTISIMAKKGKKEKGLTIYCHWDGYPQYNGNILLEHYQNADKIKELISLGDISSLREKIHPDPKGGKIVVYDGARRKEIFTTEPHSFDKPHEGVVVSYGRDRGAKDVQATSFLGKPTRKEEFDYLFVEEENQWYIRNNHLSKPRFVKLTEKMCR